MKTILEMGKAAREASRFLMNISTNKKNEFLLKLADALDANRSAILAANKLDYDAADQLTPAMRDRLLLNDARIDGIIRDVRHVAELPDGELYALIRADYAKNALMRQTRSTDGGKTWEPIAPTPLSGLPPHLLVLKDGRLLAAYGRRTNDRGGFGEYASHSSDGGRTWDCEVKLSGATNDDLGYPASVELDDGAILTVYYQQPPEGGKSCIMATKWKPVR